jgi:hypothetical protein
MPSKLRFLVALRGDDVYERYLDGLLKAVRKSGVEVETTHQLGEHALAELGSRFGLAAPPRSKPHGTNRYTAGSEPGAEQGSSTGR